MKLLVCLSEYPPINSSGIGNVAYEVVKKLRVKGIKCTVCSPTGPDIKLGSSAMIKKFAIIGLLYYWYQVSKHLKKNDFDVVWLHNPLFLKDSPFRRSLATIHTTYYGFMIKKINPKYYYMISSKIEKYCLNKIGVQTKITITSKQVSRELMELGIPGDRINFIIPNGVDTERFKPSNNKKLLRKKYRLPENDVIILSFGRLTEVKQPHKLIEVFSKIEKEINNVILVIAGGGELLNETKEFVRQNKLNNVRFLGYVDEKDKPDIFACSDLYIMTSRYEGFPLTCFEAMSSGLPLIVSNIPILSELIEESKVGIIVDFKDIIFAANSILQYLKNDQLIEKQSVQARRFITIGWDWKDISNKYLEEFKKLFNYQNKGEIL